MVNLIDIKLDDRGDICLKNKTSIIKLRINFGISKYPIFKATIRQHKEYEKKDDKYKSGAKYNRLKIRIKTADNKPQKLSSQSYHDIEELRQRIMILLKTNKGEIKSSPKKNFGSRLNIYKHEDATKTSTQNSIAELIQDEIAGILDDPYVVVRHEYVDNIFYCQNLTAYIYDGEQLICDMKLEET